jgi:hypothetical protein
MPIVVSGAGKYTFTGNSLDDFTTELYTINVLNQYLAGWYQGNLEQGGGMTPKDAGIEALAAVFMEQNNWDDSKARQLAAEIFNKHITGAEGAFLGTPTAFLTEKAGFHGIELGIVAGEAETEVDSEETTEPSKFMPRAEEAERAQAFGDVWRQEYGALPGYAMRAAPAAAQQRARAAAEMAFYLRGAGGPGSEVSEMTGGLDPTEVPVENIFRAFLGAPEAAFDPTGEGGRGSLAERLWQTAGVLGKWGQAGADLGETTANWIGDVFGGNQPLQRQAVMEGLYGRVAPQAHSMLKSHMQRVYDAFQRTRPGEAFLPYAMKRFGRFMPQGTGGGQFGGFAELPYGNMPGSFPI